MFALLMHFKARLDKFWQHQLVKFDFTADLAGTGNRSAEVILFVYDILMMQTERCQTPASTILC